MLALAHSAAMLGIDGYVVRVEADSAKGTPGFSLIGLPDRALGEARDRVRAAVIYSGNRFPAGKVLVNLSPAAIPTFRHSTFDIRKVGPGFDLAIALALLAIEEQVDKLALQRFIAVGELALDGTIRPTRGVLPMTIAARNSGFDALVVPRGNAAGASLVDGIGLYAVDTLHDAIAITLGHGEKYRYVASKRPTHRAPKPPATSATCAANRWQNERSRSRPPAAITSYSSDHPVAAKRCSHVYYRRSCPPCPPKKRSTLQIYSVAGLLEENRGIVATWPFRSPHHTISQIALCGGGNSPRPGEISLAKVVFSFSTSFRSSRVPSRGHAPAARRRLDHDRARRNLRVSRAFHARCIDEPMSVWLSRRSNARLPLRRCGRRALRRRRADFPRA